MKGWKLFNAITILVGLTGILFVSLVPPMRIPEGEMNCRFHFMAERAWPFTQTYAVKYPDVQAMISEYGVIVSVCAIILCLGYIIRTARGKANP